MKKIIITILALFLTACPNESEIKKMTEDSKNKRQEAYNLISLQDFSTDNLLIIQNYFFDFSEKVHLMKEDSNSLESIKGLIKKNGFKHFCEKFIIPVQQWQILENYCNSSNIYKCSPDIQSYKDTVDKFLELLGKDLKSRFQKEATCN